MSELKICTRCGKGKSLSEYRMIKSGKQKGTYVARCRDCLRILENEARAREPEKHRERDRNCAARNRESIREKDREKYVKNYKKKLEYNEKFKVREPEKFKARKAVSTAVRLGRFPPAWTMVCEDCKEAQSSHWHHHRGYSEEYKLDVIALCTECHGKTYRIAQ